MANQSNAAPRSSFPCHSKAYHFFPLPQLGATVHRYPMPFLRTAILYRANAQRFFANPFRFTSYHANQSLRAALLRFSISRPSFSPPTQFSTDPVQCLSSPCSPFAFGASQRRSKASQFCSVSGQLSAFLFPCFSVLFPCFSVLFFSGATHRYSVSNCSLLIRSGS